MIRQGANATASINSSTPSVPLNAILGNATASPQKKLSTENVCSRENMVSCSTDNPANTENADKVDDASDTESDSGSPCALRQPVWATSPYTKKQIQSAECSQTPLKPAPVSTGMAIPGPEHQSVVSTGKAATNPLHNTMDSSEPSSTDRANKVGKELEEKQAAALQIMREARRQSEWTSRAAEERAIREREEAERRRQEVELAREAERRRDEELRRAEEERRSLLEARKREDKAKLKAMVGVPERINAHELLSEFENSVDLSYIDACFAMRRC